MSYLKMIYKYYIEIKEVITNLITIKTMDNSSNDKRLIHGAKIKRMIKKVDFSLFPFTLTIKKIAIYDKFDKVEVSNKQITIKLNKK